MHDAVIDTIVADIKANAPDHLAITGDLVNLALDGEIEMAKHWLETLGPPHDVSVVPGNHDAYVPGAFDKVCRAWAPWMSGETKKAAMVKLEAVVDRIGYPEKWRDYSAVQVARDDALGNMQRLAKKAAEQLGIKIDVIGVRDASDLEKALTKPRRVDAGHAGRRSDGCWWIAAQQ